MKFSTASLITAMSLGLTAGAIAQPASNHTFQSYDAAGNPIATPTITGSGATLFVDFFKAAASTNDFLDVDGDGVFGGGGSFIDQLAPSVTLGNTITWDASPGVAFEDQTYWGFQYYSVGSSNGFQDLVNSASTRFLASPDLPNSVPSENGLFNRSEWGTSGGNLGYGPNAGASSVTSGVGTVYANTSGTPYATPIDFSLTDVPSLHVVRKLANPALGYDGGANEAASTDLGTWNATPTQAGYGFNPVTSGSNVNAVSPGFSNNLKSLENANGTPGAVALNQNVNSPDSNTLFDTTVAYGPVGIIANYGTGFSTSVDANNNGTIEASEVKVGGVEQSNLQHAFTTGRMNSGENLNVAVRDSGSGTRNGAMTSLGIDPAWGRGDNDGSKASSSDSDVLGPDFQVAHRGGSSRMEGVVQNNRLTIGYTGLSGSSRSVKDNLDGKYEVLEVMFDEKGGIAYVKPTVQSIVDNANVNTGYQIGGLVTFTTLGDPLAETFDINEDGDTNDLGETGNGSGNPASNQNVAEYLRNITESIASFTSVPGRPVDEFMPGEFLADVFFLPAALEALPNVADPDAYIAQARNATLATYIKDNNNFDASINRAVVTDPADVGPNDWGTNASRPFGRTPGRLASGTYDDAGAGGAYVYRTTVGGPDQTILGGSAAINEANSIAFDFNQDGARDINDAVKLVEAARAIQNDFNGDLTNDYADLMDWGAAQVPHGTFAGGLAANVVVPAILGDANGDGNFRDDDVRFFADGLVLVDNGIDVNGDGVSDPTLDRAAGFAAVDNAPAAGGNFFGTTLATGKPYVAGDSRADVSGSVLGANKGGAAIGSDGVVDAQDIEYIQDQFRTNQRFVKDFSGNWSSLDEAVGIDLSADMNADLVVNWADAADVVNNVLGTTFADVDLDGNSNETSDRDIIKNNWGAITDPTFTDGDTDGNDNVGVRDYGNWVEENTPATGAGTASAVYNFGTGEIEVDVDNVLGWVIESASASLDGAAVSLGGFFVEDTDISIGEAGDLDSAGLLSYIQSLGNVADTGLAGSDLALYYWDGTGFNTGAITLVPEPASVALIGLGAGLVMRRRRQTQG